MLQVRVVRIGFGVWVYVSVGIHIFQRRIFLAHGLFGSEPHALCRQREAQLELRNGGVEGEVGVYHLPDKAVVVLVYAHYFERFAPYRLGGLVHYGLRIVVFGAEPRPRYGETGVDYGEANGREHPLQSLFVGTAAVGSVLVSPHDVPCLVGQRIDVGATCECVGVYS